MLYGFDFCLSRSHAAQLGARGASNQAPCASDASPRGWQGGRRHDYMPVAAAEEEARSVRAALARATRAPALCIHQRAYMRRYVRARYTCACVRIRIPVPSSPYRIPHTAYRIPHTHTYTYADACTYECILFVCVQCVHRMNVCSHACIGLCMCACDG